MTCPECGAPLQVERCCVIEEQVYQWGVGRPHKRLAAAALCTACEYCAELERGQLPAAEGSDRS